MKSTIRDIHQQLVSGAKTCRDIVQEKISLLRGNEYHSGNLLLEESSLALAAQVDGKIKAGQTIGLLEGIPFGIKDVLLLQGSVASGSSAMLKNYVSPFTATAVQKLIDAGAIPVVKENCDCFGHGGTGENTAYGTVVNAHDKSKLAGGSSGGSAVNVAKGYTVFSIGGDTGGSVRQPAGYNKVYALKPTYGRVSRYGIMAYASSTDCVSPIASSLEDIRILINTMSGKDENDQTTYLSESIPENIFDSNRQISVGYYKNFIENEYLDAKIKDAFLKMIEKIKDKGIKVIPLDFFDINVLVSTYYVLAMAETASNLARLDGSVYGARTNSKNIRDGYMITRSENFTEETKRRIIGGNQVMSQGHDEEIYLKARIIKNQIINAFKADFEKVGIILSPASMTLPPSLGESLKKPLSMYMSDACTVGFSLGGLPTLSAPLFTPTGIQITANKNQEDLILSFTNYLENIE